MKLIFTSFFIFIIFAGLRAQSKEKVKTIKARVTQQAEILPNKHMEEIKQDLIDLAKQTAISQQFGTAIYKASGSSTSFTNDNGQIKGKENFESIANSYIKGKWIETTKVECERIPAENKNRYPWLSCTVEGKIAEISSPPINLLVEPMSCLQKGCERTDFIGESDFFLHFKSPAKGYVAVYLSARADEIVQCLLPETRMGKETSAVNVEADKDYYFFQHAGYQLYSERDFELDLFYVIFSTEPFFKPILEEAIPDEDGFIFPRELSIPSFEKWLGAMRSQQKNVQVKEIVITLRN